MAGSIEFKIAEEASINLFTHKKTTRTHESTSIFSAYGVSATCALVFS